MPIVHIRGTQCSGKTWAVEPFIHRNDVAFWDILGLYNREGCIVNDVLDWDKWEATKLKIIPELRDFIRVNYHTKKLLIVETGSNATVNDYLDRCQKHSKCEVITVTLKVPPLDTLKQRAKERGLNEFRVLNFRKIMKYKDGEKLYTQEEARELISKLLEEKQCTSQVVKE